MRFIPRIRSVIDIVTAICKTDGLIRAQRALYNEFFPSPVSAPVVIQTQPHTHSLFAPVEAQLALVRKCNAEREWGFTEEDFRHAEHNIPSWPEDRLVAVVLVPYLTDKRNREGETLMSGIQRTFLELPEVTTTEQKMDWRWRAGEADSGPDHLRLHEGIQHRPGLRWEVIDLGANWNKEDGLSPEKARSPRSAHAGILAAAALHPNWVKAMDGKNVPFVWISGYECSAPEMDKGRLWGRAPGLFFGQEDGKLGLSECWIEKCNPRLANPVIMQ